MLGSHKSDLDEITGKLRHLLDTIAPCCGNAPAMRAVSPQEMGDLLSCLMRAGQSLRSENGVSAVTAQAIAEYRIVVERLHALLPSIHSTLLEERSRLEQQRDRMRLAGEWLRRSRETL
ncbi:MAG TPA: hypothetical protein VMS18_03945 [Candidatus Binatia bacterium]|nr:hypothetical protein [Candidatus Binatia bacterium]